MSAAFATLASRRTLMKTLVPTTPSLHAASLVIALLGPATAEPLHDPTTGLAIDPPPSYVARALRPTSTFVSRFQVKKATDRDTGCQVAFTPQSQNGGFTQNEINAILQKAQWLDVARATIAINYDLHATDPFQHGDLIGVAIVGDIKARPSIPPRSQEIRTLFIIIETPKGRATTICVGERADFDTRRSEFEAVARATTVPR
jgi:hypothetical protein